MTIKIAPNIHFRPVFSFQSASHDAATARRSAQLPPYIKPERAAAQSHAVALGAESRNRCLIPFQEVERSSTAAPIRAATNMHVSGRISKRWKMRHQEAPPWRRFGPSQ